MEMLWISLAITSIKTISRQSIVESDLPQMWFYMVISKRFVILK
jgi:hypothetical protein